jgi:hypothetical protein
MIGSWPAGTPTSYASHDPEPPLLDIAEHSPGFISTCSVCDREIYLTKPTLFRNRWGTEVWRPTHWRHAPVRHVKVRTAPTLRELRARIEALADAWLREADAEMSMHRQSELRWNARELLRTLK